MSEVFVRSLTAAALVVIALMALVLGGYFFAVLVAAAATGIYYEWMRIVRGWGLSWYVGGFIYALLPALALLWLRDRADNGMALVVWVFLVTWATDIGAYFVGRTFGRTKLAPAISPGKTVAGLWGGIAAATVIAGAWAWFTGLSQTLFVLAAFFALFAQMGDLFESWMKRRAGIKDSGNWLPGHGGLLDRLDGLVPVATLTAFAQLGGLL
ncbi:MAG TPA: phosphatidate cytidylyltransferase [Sphingomicrobium sp.]|nr:phosphatidate cytidylyltransferase [Sphingomicrobium sp.]